MSASRSTPIALVGRELPGEENLGLRYLGQALIDRGIPVRILPLNGPGDLVRVADRLLGGAPIIGISLADNHVAADLLALVAYLRARGYAGRIVAGGAFATLARHRILARHPGIDCIIRHEGETTLVAVTERWLEGQDVDGLAGVTTRKGDGPPRVEQSVTPIARPLREAELPNALGLPTAWVMASRGCSGGCSYCGSAALRRDAAKGVPGAAASTMLGKRLRDLGDFADELAELYHLRRVRFFRLVDDHVLGPHETQALRWLVTLRSELGRRQVGRVAFAFMVEPSVVTDEVIRAMVELGVIRTLVGVEALTESGLSALGRDPRLVAHNRRTVERLEAAGISVFHNSILVHPASTGSSIAAELAALPLIPSVPFEALPLLVFPGTALYRRLEQQGKLLGGWLGCDYELADLTASTFRSLLFASRQRLPEWGRLTAGVHELDSWFALARQLGIRSARGRGRLRSAIATFNQWQLEVLRELLDLAASRPSRASRERALGDFIARAECGLTALARRVEALRRSLEREKWPLPSALRTFAVTASAAGLLVVGPGCGAASELAPGRGGASLGGAGHGAAGGAGGRAQGGTSGTGGTTTCDWATVSAIDQRLTSVVAAACPSASLPPGECSPGYTLSVDAAGNVTDVTTSYFSPSDPRWPELKRCILQAVASEKYPCLTDGFVWGRTPCRLI